MNRITQMIVIGLLGASSLSHAQSKPDYSKMFGEFVAKTDAHKVDIYAEEIGKKKVNAVPSDKMRARFYEDLRTLGGCAIQRSVLYDLTDQSRWRDDAVRLLLHYEFFAKALERHELVSADEAIAAYQRDRKSVKNQFRADYIEALSGSDDVKKQELEPFFKRCDEAATVTNNIDAAALKRNSSGN